MEEKFITVSFDDGVHKYPENSTWEINDGYLTIKNEEGDDIANYNIGQWKHVSKTI